MVRTMGRIMLAGVSAAAMTAAVVSYAVGYNHGAVDARGQAVRHELARIFDGGNPQPSPASDSSLSHWGEQRQAFVYGVVSEHPYGNSEKALRNIAWAGRQIGDVVGEVIFGEQSPR